MHLAPMASSLSSPSHKRRRHSQSQIRRLYAARDERQNTEMPSRNSADRSGNSLAESQTRPSISASAQGPTSRSHPDVPDIPGLTYRTPPTIDPPFAGIQQPAASTNSEPTTLLGSTAVSDLSTIPSSAQTNTNHPSPPALMLTRVPPDAGRSNPQATGHALLHQQPISSLAFNIWHRKGSFGHVQFGTQSSPPKAMHLVHPPTTTTNVASVPERTTTAAAAPSNPTNTTASTTSATSTTRGDPVRPPMANVRVRKIDEGCFLIPLRKAPPLQCRRPGPSVNHPPLVVVTQKHTGSKKTLPLASNNGAQLMRRAKNFTSGVARSPTGSSKQRRYLNATTTKRKHNESEVENEDDNTQALSPRPLQMVTSFALRTLLIEDIWFLKVGTPVVLFFHDALLPPKYSKRLLDVWKHTLQCNTVPTVMCQGRPYKQLIGWVHKNCDASESVIGLTHLNDVVRKLSEHSQNGIKIKFPIFDSKDFTLTAPPAECYEELLSWFEIFRFPQAVFLQCDYHPERTWLAIFNILKDAGDDRLTMLHRLVQETTGDRFMLAELRMVWQRLVVNSCAEKGIVEQKELIDSIRKEAANAPPSPLIETEVVQGFCDNVDQRILERLEDCFGRFNNIFEKFLSEAELRHFAKDFERMLPRQFSALMGYSGYTKKLEALPESERGFVRLRFTIDVFFQFVMKVRQHNNHRLVPFGMIFALGQFACGHPLLATQIPVWLGLSVSKRTMERRLEEWLSSYDSRTKTAIRRVTHLLCVFDNLQDGRKLQFQQGQSSIFTKVTARFLMSMHLALFPDWVYSFRKRPELTFIKQAIPSPYQIPALENQSDRSVYDVLCSIGQGNYESDLDHDGNPFDCSGIRVAYYQQLTRCCRELHMVRRFLSTKRQPGQNCDYTLQPTEFALHRVRFAIVSALNKLRKNRESNIFEVARQFPTKIVRTWRHEPPLAELLILPVSVLDETTKIGASGVIVDFMVLHGLLRWNEYAGIYEPGDGWEEKWLYVVGDGLSLDRIFQFFDDVMTITDAKTTSFRQAYRQAMAITQVIHRVVPINGDLHVRFHMLDAVYRLFYGGFLQPIQYRLQWKRLYAQDVSKSYQLAHRLAVMVFDEVDRIMIDVFVTSTMTLEKTDEILHFQGGEGLAVHIAEQYMVYLQRQVKECKDWLHRYLSNYLLIMCKYLAFLEAEQIGDAVTMEAVVIEYLPILYATGKDNSFNTQVRLVELYYERIPISVLQTVRLNRTKQQKRGVPGSRLTKESALDQIMERLMPFFKGMNHNGTKAAFVRTSKMLTACQRAKHFIEYYTRHRSDAEYEWNERELENAFSAEAIEAGPLTDPGQRNKTTTRPSTKLNRVLVTEILTIANCHKVRVEGAHVMDKNVFWRALDTTTMQVHKKIRYGGDGRVETDATDKFVIVQVDAMMRHMRTGPHKKEYDAKDSKNEDTAMQGDKKDVDEDDSTVIDLAEVMDDDDWRSTGANEMAYFSDDETIVVDVEKDARWYDTSQPVTMEEAAEENGDDEGNVSGQDSNKEQEEIPETQIEEVLLATADEVPSEEDDDEEKENRTKEKEDKVDGSKQEKLREKAKVKGMKVVDMNPMAATDIVGDAVQAMEKKNVLKSRQRDVVRKQREHHFLRHKLFTRLQEMEDTTSHLQWVNHLEECMSVTERLDRSINLFKAFKDDNKI